jgi:RNA polymerase subunit RPABC4/transcription elongation factor Spt4
MARLILLQVMSAPLVKQQVVKAWNVACLAVLLFVIVAVCELVMGGICGRLTESAGRSYWLGFALGFLLNVVGLAIGFLFHLLGGKRPLTKPSLPHGPAFSVLDYVNELPPPEKATSHLISRALPVPPPRQAFSEGVKVCPNCRLAIPIISDHCWNCGASMIVGVPGKACSHCFTLSPPAAGFCRRCGMDLEDNRS